MRALPLGCTSALVFLSCASPQVERGPQGERGEEGAAGEPGAVGATGAPGATGAMGTGSPFGVHTIVVRGDGSPTENGAALLEAFGALAPNASNRYVVKLESATYDLGLSSIALNGYVDLEGSGDGTLLTAAGGEATLMLSYATYPPSTNTHVRYLSIDNTGGSPVARAILATGNGEHYLHHLRLKASNSSGAVEGVALQQGATLVVDDTVVLMFTGASVTCFQVGGTLFLSSSRCNVATGGNGTGIGVAGLSHHAELFNVRLNISASNTAIGVDHDDDSYVVIRQSTFSISGSGAAYGLRSSGHADVSGAVMSASLTAAATVQANGANAMVSVRDSRLLAPLGATTLHADGGTLRVANSLVDGDVVNTGGTLSCLHAYDKDFTALGSDCQ